MQAEAETILTMSETLESANFTRDQSDAFIQSTALAMKTFAVTPALLDDRLSKLSLELRREWKQDLKESKDDTNRRFDEQKEQTNLRFNYVDQRLDNLDKRLDDIQELQRSMLRYFLTSTLVIVAGLMGAIGTFLAS